MASVDDVVALDALLQREEWGISPPPQGSPREPDGDGRGARPDA